MTVVDSASAAASAASASHEAHFFALSLDLLGVIGTDGEVKKINPAWARLLGQESEATTAVIGWLRAGEPVAGYECQLPCSDDQIRTFAWTATPGDEVFYVVGRDITDQLALEHELTRRAERLEQTNAELQEFAYVASHDLTEPLRMVTSYLQLLERRFGESLDDQAREFMGYAIDGARRMMAMIDDLLVYSRVANRDVQRQPVDLGAVAVEVVRTLQEPIAAAGATVEIGELPVVRAEPTQMVQLLQNLIANAVKFRAPDRPGHVAVTARRAQDGWDIAVADNGIGISSRDRDRIFKMFTRLHGPDEYAGSGIGLAVCRRIVERHGGTLEVESVIGEGTTFTVHLPDEDAA